MGGAREARLTALVATFAVAVCLAEPRARAEPLVNRFENGLRNEGVVSRDVLGLDRTPTGYGPYGLPSSAAELGGREDPNDLISTKKETLLGGLVDRLSMAVVVMFFPPQLPIKLPPPPPPPVALLDPPPFIPTTIFVPPGQGGGPPVAHLPEPGTMLSGVLGAALAAFAAWRRRRATA